jgi:hypothetical protein
MARYQLVLACGLARRVLGAGKVLLNDTLLDCTHWNPLAVALSVQVLLVRVEQGEAVPEQEPAAAAVATAAASCCSRIPAHFLVTGTCTRDASACAPRMAHGGTFGLHWGT